jgi:hypothetical protein
MVEVTLRRGGGGGGGGLTDGRLPLMLLLPREYLERAEEPGCRTRRDHFFFDLWLVQCM